MTILTKSENDLVEAYIRDAKARLDELGLALYVGSDLEACRAAHATVPSALRYPMTHDPAHNWLHPGNSFWLAFMANERVIAIAPHRMMETESLVAEFYCHRGFGNRVPVLHTYNLGLKDGLPALSGRLGNSGAVAVHRDWHRLGLGGLVARVAQVLSIRRFWVDYLWSLTADTEKGRSLVRNAYRMAHSVPLMDGPFPINDGKIRQMRLNWSSRAEILDRVEVELGAGAVGLDQASKRIGDLDDTAIEIAERHH